MAALVSWEYYSSLYSVVTEDQFEKHVVPKIVTPEQNQSADAWKFGYRNVSIADGYENKVKGIYLHKNA